MQMTGEKLIPEPRSIVWKALNDPAILRECVPGCQSLEKISDTEMVASAAIRVGPVSAKFGGKISLSELNEPVSYRISGEGQGGVAGFAKGSALIHLDEVEGGTLLRYDVDAQVGGKLAQLGGRLIDATARKMAEAFFEKFAVEIRRQYHGDGATPPAPTDAAGPAAASAAPAVAVPPAATLPPGMAPGWFPPPGAYYPPPPAEAPVASRAPLFSALAVAAVFAFLWIVERQGTAPALAATQPLSPEFGSAVQLILIAAVGYLFGRSTDRRR